MAGEAYEERYSIDREPYGFALKLPVFVAFGMTALAVSRNGHSALGAIFTAVVDALPFDGLPRLDCTSAAGMRTDWTPHDSPSLCKHEKASRLGVRCRAEAGACAFRLRHGS
jgi:hypothetical protein